MNKISKRSLNMVLALFLALNLSGCSLFGEDEEDAKGTVKHNEDTTKNKDNKKDKKKNSDKVKEKDDSSIQYTEDKNSQSNNSYTQSVTKPIQPQINNTKPVVVNTDFTKLHSLLVEYKNMDLTAFTPKSISIFQSAIQRAERILNTPSASQIVVDQEIQSLKDAKNKLVHIADFSALSSALETSKTINMEQYTPISVSLLTEAMKSAAVIMNDKNSTQTNINETTELLHNAIQGLVLRADNISLQDAIKKAKDIKDADYTDSSLMPMYASLKLAEQVCKNLNATQTAVDEATKDLNNKLDALVVYIAPDTNELKALIIQAKSYKENEYSVSSYRVLVDAVKKAEAVLEIKKVTKDEISKTTNLLQKAIDGLDVDLTALHDELSKAKNIKESVYTPASYKRLKKVMDESDAFVLDAHKQYEIDEQTNKLTSTINQLVKRADKKDLEKAVNDAKALYSGDYTETTMKYLKQMVSEAEQIYIDHNATQEQVSNAVKNVNDAIHQLEVVIHKEKLQDAIDKSKDIKESDYTPKSYGPFKTAYEQAVNINEDEEATQQQVDACTSALESTLSNLVERSDFSVLKQKITNANAIDPDQYTDASLVGFHSELKKAENLVKDLNATQEQVNQQVESLTQAINLLIAYIAPDMDEINQAIANADAVKEDDWSTDSYQAMKKKLDYAKEIIQKKKVTQEEVDKAKDELISTYDTLTVDLDTLNQTLNHAKKYQEINYTLDSFAVLQNAIKKTENFLNDTHTQSEINAETNALQSAIDQLELFEEADKTSLIAVINNAKAMNENEYTPNSYIVLKDALRSAESVNDNYRATVNEIQSAINTLESAKANLVKRADTTALDQVIREAKTKYDGGYTTSSINALKQVVAGGEIIFNNANVTQNDVDSKVEEIKQAINDLIKLGDKTGLSSLIDELEALQESDYTPISWVSASLGTLIDDAKVIRDKPDATEAEVNTALDSLTNSKAKLVKKADITELENEIVKAKEEAKKGYTAQSLSDLNKAIAEAETVKDNPNSSAVEVSEVLTKLKNAMNSLRVDVTALIVEINTAKGVNTTGKKPSTVTVLHNAIKEAEAMKDDDSITFKQMNNMIQKLKDAVNGLQDVTDVSDLQTKVDEVKALNKAEYTPDSYALLEGVLQEAINALANENITVDEVRQLIQKLDTAVNDLEYVPTKEGKRKECEKAIEEAYALLNDPIFQGPTNLKKALQERTEAAEFILTFPDDELTIEEIQQQIDIVKSRIKDYRDNEYDVQGMIALAQAKLAEFRALNADDYSSETYVITEYYADLLEERIATGIYEDIKPTYDWLVEHMAELAPKDTNTYIKEEVPGEVLALLNAQRKAQGLGELTLDPTLCKATDIRATEAHEQTGDFGVWAHKRPDGRKWSTVLDEVGHPYNRALENFAIGVSTTGDELYKQWYNSSGHRNNMLDPEVTKVGVSMIKVGEGAWISYMILTD